jgi:UDP-N-acetylmuramate dehydrogenase
MLTKHQAKTALINNQNIQENVSLADKNWFKTGGPARYYAEPKTNEEFQHCLRFSIAQQQPIFLLGNGANILISDEGFDGLVIRPQLTTKSITQLNEEYNLVIVGSGAVLDDLIEFCLQNNLGGLEEFSGIPGTVGGAVYINLHYFEFLLSQFLDSAQMIEKSTGKILTVNADWFNFGYNQSTLQEGNHYLLSASFKLKKLSNNEVAFARGRKKEIIRHRAARYPNSNTCGSFFRNFYPEEVTIESNNTKMIYIAYYLDKLGIKGALSVGDAIVSYKHANMIINQGNATTQDIIELAKKMQQSVKESFHIIPQPECRLIGFKEYPLL